eukprot:5434959-Amphidinium_carterae.1
MVSPSFERHMGVRHMQLTARMSIDSPHVRGFKQKHIASTVARVQFKILNPIPKAARRMP